ncbi:MAG: pyridoxal 5'-phosphate synthase glutaminase subunit PdxT [Candidatus Izemoplasmatales bacterium]|jgi:5'-phosphate synthase pdxT subunit|nr:pyridoxal 5'-phosphate synthase glutaminase subunit PdxT [Candidatus Izemoplasmatales bacterium]MDD4987456.1 pyridoxal 5'-phosphate synthase glutaminase subunit PdxT [Candidatus Izemoplasmatales bacterium]MDD5601548.1 pyridoxal 5'-phosphate synthase glutaminase subunit PdxT [Candidatus Izemoplasmatales bacterium]NLF48811.1 pyridoxal 5'-phosphate synthase glutaminase subunit PdxT [Acholeplasmataceae bacterium]
MHIGILALQGAFFEHGQMLDKIGISHHEIRSVADFLKPLDGLIIPGGESTTIGKLLSDLQLMNPIREKIQNGLPVLGTCAGLILLAKQTLTNGYPSIGTLDVVVKRNAYGRQLGSFFTKAEIAGIGSFPMVFIRAPYIESVGESVQVLATVDDHIVMVKSLRQTGVAFHPELTEDDSIHRLFLNDCIEYEKSRS